MKPNSVLSFLTFRETQQMYASALGLGFKQIDCYRLVFIYHWSSYLLMHSQEDFQFALLMIRVLVDAGKGGISSKTIVIIVVSTVVSVVIFSILCYCLICSSARKKYDAVEAENGKLLAPHLNNPLFLFQ